MRLRLTAFFLSGRDCSFGMQNAVGTGQALLRLLQFSGLLHENPKVSICVS